MNNHNPLELMALQAEALYQYDARGRMRCVNEPPYDQPPPNLFLGRTPQGNLWRFAHNLPEALVEQLAALCAAEPVVADFAAPPTQRAAILALLAQHATVGEEERGPAYWFERVPPPSPRAVLINQSDAALLQSHFPDEHYPPEAGPVAIVIDDGVAVARCFCARLTPRAAEAGLETAPAYRGRSYAVAAVATWAAAVAASGRVPLYSTSWQNTASQAVARRLGLWQYGEDWSVG